MTTKRRYRHQAKATIDSELRAAAVAAQEDLIIDCSLVFASDDASDEMAEGAERLPTYSGVAYNGDDIYQKQLEFPVVVNLATAKIAKTPQQMLKDHDPAKPIGHHTPIITATEMRLENGVLSVPNMHRDEVAAGAKNGFPWQASIRGRMGKVTLLKAGQTRTVNGRIVTGPRFIADNFLWRETTATGWGRTSPVHKFLFPRQMNLMEKLLWGSTRL